MLIIIDMRIGNLGSVYGALQRVGGQIKIAESCADIENASKIVLPGVGTFGDAMEWLHCNNFIEPLRRAACERQVPLLGICLGMQLLASGSEEFGEHHGLDLIPGHVTQLDASSGLVPNMGWHSTQIRQGSEKKFGGTNEAAFYFAHSFHMICADPDDVAADFSWGGMRVTAAVRHNSIFGVQFHPEKSQDAGLALLHAFVNIPQHEQQS